MTLRLNYLLALGLACAAFFAATCASAYTIQSRDEVTHVSRIWQVEPVTERFAYYVQVDDERSGKIHFQNLTEKEAAFSFRLDAHQRGIRNPDVSLKPGETKVLPVAFARVNQSIGVSPLRVAAPGEKMPDVPELTDAVIPEKACFVMPYQDDVTFNPRALAYFIKRKDATTVELHFKSYAAQAVHFDFRILGYQTPLPDNPRLTVPANDYMELLIDLPASDNLVALGVVEIFNIRLNDDTGSLMAERKEPFQPHRIVKDRDWSTLAVFDEETADFNPAAIVRRAVSDGTTVQAMEFKNLGQFPVHFDFFLDHQTIENNGNPRVSLQPGEVSRVSIKPFQALKSEKLLTFPKNVRIGPDSGPYVMKQPPAVPVAAKEWLHPVPFAETPLFDPLMLGYLITPAADKKTLTVTFNSKIATRVSFDFQILGYPSPEGSPSSRASLLPGQDVNVPVQVTKSDARASIAKIQISNMRVGGETRKAIMDRK